MDTSDASNHTASSSKGLRQAIRRHPLFFYFLLAYAISWILLIPYVLAEWGVLRGNFTFMYVLHTFGPSASAIIVTSVIEGKGGLRRLRDRIRQWRVDWIWYAFILLGIPALLVLGIVVQPEALASFQGLTARVLVSYPFYFVAVFFGGGPLGEEIGWRGFALPRMQPRYGPLGGTLLLGVLWACWHLLDFLTASKGGGAGASLTTFLVNFPVFFLMVLSLAIVFTWLFNHTRGSVFIAILAHASVNTPELTLVPLFLSMDMIAWHRAGLIAFGALALLILVLTRGRLGYQEG
jgi:membrane protease YdiL (CAAX protease family)